MRGNDLTLGLGSDMMFERARLNLGGDPHKSEERWD